MVRLALGNKWHCSFANDFNYKKAAIYKSNFHSNGELFAGDIAEVSLRHLPHVANLAWASFPCQDLSQAGAGRGLAGERSGTFWLFWRLMRRLAKRKRGPHLIVVENVCGALASRGGKDFQDISDAFARLGYSFGAVVIDAKHFVPHSRPRLFIIGARKDIVLPRKLIRKAPSEQWHPPSLRKAQDLLCSQTKDKWVWWHLPPPPVPDRTLADLIEWEKAYAPYDSNAETQKLVSMISKDHLERLRKARRGKPEFVATVYRRMRPAKNGRKIQRAEVRTDGLAGCLRTPSGGSSRQTVLVANGGGILSRKMTPREAARLMGIPESYELPNDQGEAYHLVADGVVVPVVQFLNDQIFLPILSRLHDEARKAGSIGNHAAGKVTGHYS